VSAVGRLLAAEAGGAQRFVAEREEGARGERRGEPGEARKGRPRRGERDLLFEDDEDERREARLARP
jgi:hypothetical protein